MKRLMLGMLVALTFQSPESVPISEADSLRIKIAVLERDNASLKEQVFILTLMSEYRLSPTEYELKLDCGSVMPCFQKKAKP